MRLLKFSILFLFLFPSILLGEYVRHVIDGDTFVLQDNQRVRMIGIDTPEVSNPRYKKLGEPYGEEAKRQLRDLIEKRNVELKAGFEDFDKYGRRLSYVYLENGDFINLMMIEQGHAEAYRRFDHPFKAEFIKAEAKAKKMKIGMWAHKKTWQESMKEFFGR